MKNPVIKVLLYVSIISLLSGCNQIDKIGKKLAAKHIEELKNTIAEQQEKITQLSTDLDAMTQQLANQQETKTIQEPSTIEKKSRNISSMFSRE